MDVQLMLEMDLDVLATANLPYIDSNQSISSPSQMIIPDCTPPLLRYSMIFDVDRNEWIRPEDEVDVEEFMRELERGSTSSTQIMECDKCLMTFQSHASHVCVPCAACNKLICICGWSAEECGDCGKLFCGVCVFNPDCYP